MKKDGENTTAYNGSMTVMTKVHLNYVQNHEIFRKRGISKFQLTCLLAAVRAHDDLCLLFLNIPSMKGVNSESLKVDIGKVTVRL